MPGESSGCFVSKKKVFAYTRSLKVAYSGSRGPLICFVIAAGSADPLPIFMCSLAYVFIPVFLHNKKIFRCLINDILWLVIEFFYFVVIIV